MSELVEALYKRRKRFGWHEKVRSYGGSVRVGWTLGTDSMYPTR